MKGFLIGFLLLLMSFSGMSQELFIHNEPASVLPKSSLAFRSIHQFYKEDGLLRSRQALRVTRGMTAKWELGIEAGLSNHNHPNLVSELYDDGDLDHDHDHGGDNVNVEHIHPTSFTGFTLYSQYRFFTDDGPNQHLRAAVYGILSTNRTTHNYAEPNLYHRNAGLSSGLILTWLKKRFAASGRLGGIVPFGFSPKENNRYFRSGNALGYSLSLGYLAYPRKYQSYKQVNINFYLELMGKAFQQARIRDEIRWYPALAEDETSPGGYLDINPGVQFILDSRFRIDISTGFPLISRSMAMDYPQFHLALQYLYF